MGAGKGQAHVPTHGRELASAFAALASCSPLWTSTVVPEYLWDVERNRRLCLPELCSSTSSFNISYPSPPLARKLGRITLYTSSVLRGS